MRKRLLLKGIPNSSALSKVFLLFFFNKSVLKFLMNFTPLIIGLNPFDWDKNSERKMNTLQQVQWAFNALIREGKGGLVVFDSLYAHLEERKKIHGLLGRTVLCKKRSLGMNVCASNAYVEINSAPLFQQDDDAATLAATSQKGGAKETNKVATTGTPIAKKKQVPLASAGEKASQKTSGQQRSIATMVRCMASDLTP
jgi:hypothetical protein